MNLNSNFSAQKASAAPLQLSRAAQQLQQNAEKASDLVAPPVSNNLATLLENILFDDFIFNRDDRNKTVKQLTNFNYEQFFCILSVIQFIARYALYTGQKIKCQFTIQDELFMLLETLKHGGE